MRKGFRSQGYFMSNFQQTRGTDNLRAVVI